MKVIIIEDKAYSVKNDVVKELQEKQKALRLSASNLDFKIYNGLELELCDFIDKQKGNWKCLGYIHFDFRL